MTRRNNCFVLALWNTTSQFLLPYVQKNAPPKQAMYRQTEFAIITT
jgi:hypothetical protein